MNNNIYTLCLGMLTTPPYDRMFEQSRRVFSPKGVAPTVHTFGGGNREIKILIEL
mgnify:CR=1 FL=1